MHIPDGFLSATVGGPAVPLAAAGVSLALKRSAGDDAERQVPLLGVVGAFVFAAQMVNFPVAPGASGHLTGGVLAAALGGPYAAAAVMSVVLAIQCLVFQDGGITALAVNILNLAFIATWGGYAVARAFARPGAGRWRFSIAAGAWCSIVMAAAAAAAELALSDVVTWRGGFVAIVGIHAIVGVGEALITVSVLSFVRRVRPDLLFAAAEEVTT